MISGTSSLQRNYPLSHPIGGRVSPTIKKIQDVVNDLTLPFYCKKAEIEKLLLAGEQFDQVNDLGETLLHIAAKNQDDSLLELFIKLHPELLTRKDKKGDTPLHVWLKATSNSVYESKRDCFFLFSEEVKKILYVKDAKGNTLLHLLLCNRGFNYKIHSKFLELYNWKENPSILFLLNDEDIAPFDLIFQLHQAYPQSRPDKLPVPKDKVAIFADPGPKISGDDWEQFQLFQKKFFKLFYRILSQNPEEFDLPTRTYLSTVGRRNGYTPLHHFVKNVSLSDTMHFSSSIAQRFVALGINPHQKCYLGNSSVSLTPENLKGHLAKTTQPLSLEVLEEKKKEKIDYRGLLFDLIYWGDDKGIAYVLRKKGASPHATTLLGDTSIMAAIKACQAKEEGIDGILQEETYELLLELNDIQSKTKEGDSLLHLAAYSGNATAMRVLIKKGLNLLERNKEGDTPLHIAVRRGHFHLHPFLALLDPDSIELENEKRETLPSLLKASFRPESIRQFYSFFHALSSLGVDFEFSEAEFLKEILPPCAELSEIYGSPLHLGNFYYPLSFETNPTTLLLPDETGSILMDRLFKFYHDSETKNLFIELQKRAFKTFLSLITKEAESPAVKDYLRKIDNHGNTLLHFFAEVAKKPPLTELSIEIAKHLISLGMNPLQKNFGFAPPDFGRLLDAQSPRHALNNSIFLNDELKLQHLLDQKRNPLDLDFHGNSSLYYAIMMGSELQTTTAHGFKARTYTLLFSQVDLLSIRDKEQNTPLHWSALFNNDRASDLLLKRGLSPREPNLYGDTPIHISLKGGSFHSVLINQIKATDVNTINQRGETFFHLLLRNFSHPKNANTSGALHVARILLFRGARLDLKDCNGETALDLIQKNNNEAVRELLGKDPHLLLEFWEKLSLADY